MNDIYLLDTNAVIGMLKGQDGIKQLTFGRKLYIPIIVVGELFYGARNSNRVNENLDKYRRFTQLYPILRIDEDTALIYAQIKHQLKLIGKPINENDYWIAALAMQHRLTLVTRDQDFQTIGGLLVVGW
jgi:tRNA(fMet)-specific endonuclease VapC